MPISPIDLYRDVLPQTDCGDCGFPTCLSFAAKVVSEQLPLSRCPHLSPETVAGYEDRLQEQYAEHKWVKRDTAQDALQWAKERSARISLQDLPGRLGGELMAGEEGPAVRLPYIGGDVLITEQGMHKADGTELTLWEQVLLYNHWAQGGEREPSGKWRGFQELPNTVSKIKTMQTQVYGPLARCCAGRGEDLKRAARELGGEDWTAELESGDAAVFLPALPRIPVLVMFWDRDQEEGFGAEVKFLFDQTVTEHLDIESILFLSEQIRKLLCAHIGRENTKGHKEGTWEAG
jgi:hypothetical protein